jgi:hypothetical protein
VIAWFRQLTKIYPGLELLPKRNVRADGSTGDDRSPRWMAVLSAVIGSFRPSGGSALLFFAQFDGPIWPVVIGVILILVLVVMGVFDNWSGTLTGCVLGFGALLVWCWDVFWPKPK